MNNQRISLKFLIPMFALLIVSTPMLAFGMDEDFDADRFGDNQFIEYERKLNAILKTRRDEEKLFVAAVVRQVQLGKIPSKLVATSFGWVLKKRPDTNYPFIYFEKVLRIQADALKLGTEIPPFDYKIYKSAGQRIRSQRSSAGQKTLTRLKAFFTPGSRRQTPEPTTGKFPDF